MAKEDLMALGPMPEAGDTEEEKAMGMAAEADKEMDDMAEMAAPEGKYSLRSINVLVDALNKILPLFDPSLPKIPSASADVVGKLSPEIIKAITMVNKAANDAMLTDLAPSIDAMVDDRGIEMVVGKLILLAKNRDFQMFLKSRPKGMEGEAPEGPETEVKLEVGVEGGAPPMASGEMDKLMMSRMGQ